MKRLYIIIYFCDKNNPLAPSDSKMEQEGYFYHSMHWELDEIDEE